MKKVFVFNGVITAVGQAVTEGVEIGSTHADAQCIEVLDNTVLGVGWRVVEADGALSFLPPDPVAPTVTPVEFLMLFTPGERISIKLAVAGNPAATPPVPPDPVLEDWWSIVTDPRLKEVILGLDSVRQAIAYLVAKGHVAEERQAEILSGRIL